MRSDRLGWAALPALLAACDASPYRCAPDARACNEGSVCTAEGYCAAPSATCPSGLRYSSSAARPDECVPVRDAGDDVPAADVAVTDAGDDVPTVDAGGDVAKADADLPDIGADAPVKDGPATDAPAVDAPVATDVPDVPDVPVADAPADVTDAPDATATPCAPVGPRLLLPLAGTRMSAADVVLRIERPTVRATRVQFEVSTRADFPAGAATRIFLGNVSAPLFVSAVAGSFARGRYFWRAQVQCADGAPSPWGPTWTFWVSGRAGTGGPTGWIPDFNGDGAGDLAVGAPPTIGAAARTGAVDVVLGAGDASAPASAWVLRPTADDLGAFGATVAPVPDMNGDGRAELAVGTCLRGTGACAGPVLLYAGRPGREPAAPLARFAPTMGGAFGTGIAGVGDLDGDGYGDLVIGDPGTTATSPGRVHVVYGGVDLPLRTESFGPTGPVTGSRGARLGWRVAGPGDVTGDGVADVLVAAFDRAYVLPGGAALAAPLTSLVPVGYLAEGEGVHGINVSAAGDFDGDGVADFAVARPLTGGTGSPGDVAVFLGARAAPASWTELAGAPLPVTRASAYGVPLAGGGDANRDVYDDLLVGAPGDGAGRVYVAFGRPRAATALVTSSPSRLVAVMSSFGRSVAWTGDLDNDGRDDVAVGALLVDVTRQGAAYVFRAAATGTEAGAQLFGGALPDYGFALSAR